MKRGALLVCLSLLIFSTGCSSQETTEQGSQNISAEKQDAQLEKDETSEVVSENTSEQNKQEQSQTNTSGEETGGKEEDVLMQKAIVYYVDDSDTVQKKTIELEVLDEQTLWQQLKNDGTVSQDTQVLSMSMNSDFQIDLDVNHAFGEQLRSLGTDGEYHVMQCVINSYLDTFSEQEIRITEEGNVLESGHVVYKGYSGMMSE